MKNGSWAFKLKSDYQRLHFFIRTSTVGGPLVVTSLRHLSLSLLSSMVFWRLPRLLASFRLSIYEIGGLPFLLLPSIFPWRAVVIRSMGLLFKIPQPRPQRGRGEGTKKPKKTAPKPEPSRCDFSLKERFLKRLSSQTDQSQSSFPS